MSNKEWLQVIENVRRLGGPHRGDWPGRYCTCGRYMGTSSVSSHALCSGHLVLTVDLRRKMDELGTRGLMYRVNRISPCVAT